MSIVTEYGTLNIGEMYPKSTFCRDGEFMPTSLFVDPCYGFWGEEADAKSRAIEAVRQRCVDELLLVQRSQREAKTGQHFYSVVRFRELVLYRVGDPDDIYPHRIQHTQWDSDALIWKVDYLGLLMAPNATKLMKKNYYDCFSLQTANHQ